MIAPVDDPHPAIAIQKGRQLGFTEALLGVKLMWAASMVTSMHVYTLPTWNKAQEFARERLNPLGQKGSPSSMSDAMLSRIENWDSLSYKHIRPEYGGGHSTIMLVSSGNESLGESTACDFSYLDEFDRMRQSVIAAFRKSLSASYFGNLRVWSTPTIPGHGVARIYQQSDKKRWFYKCSHCEHWQYLTRANIAQVKGPTNLVSRLEARDTTARVDDGTFKIVCVKCRKPITRMTERCEWVAEDPTATEYSGYALSQLDAAWISPDIIMRELRDMGLTAWHNYDLGEPYAGEMGTVVEGWLHTLVNPDVPSFDSRQYFDNYTTNLRISIGVDWGKTNWLVVLGECNEWSKPHVLAWYKFVDNIDPSETWRWVVKKAQEWNADAVVADVGYGQDRNPHVYSALGTVFYGCLYRTTAGKQVQKPSTNAPSFGRNPCSATESHPVVTIDRTSSIKEQLVALKNSMYGFARMPEEMIEEFDYHTRNIAIVTEELEDGTPFETARDTGPDHLLHALNYASIAMRWAKNRGVRMGLVSVAPDEGRPVVNKPIQQLPTASDIASQYGMIGSILGPDFDPSLF